MGFGSLQVSMLSFSPYYLPFTPYSYALPLLPVLFAIPLVPHLQSPTPCSFPLSSFPLFQVMFFNKTLQMFFLCTSLHPPLQCEKMMEEGDGGGRGETGNGPVSLTRVVTIFLLIRVSQGDTINKFHYSLKCIAKVPMFPHINPKNILCFLEINDHGLLFPKIPGRPSLVD